MALGHHSNRSTGPAPVKSSAASATSLGKLRKSPGRNGRRGRDRATHGRDGLVAPLLVEKPMEPRTTVNPDLGVEERVEALLDLDELSSLILGSSKDKFSTVTWTSCSDC